MAVLKVKRQLAVCRRCAKFLDMKEMFDVYLCGEIMEVVTPSNRCEQWVRKEVPKSCPYAMEHLLAEYNYEKKS